MVGALTACTGVPGASAAHGALRAGAGNALPTRAGAPVSGNAHAAQTGPPAWLQPPPVLPRPAANGAEGPPRPYGAEPPPGHTPPFTGSGLVQAQNHALLYGPFPKGGLTRGVSDSTLLMSSDAQVRELALKRIRATGASVVRIPVEWRYTVSPDPPAGFDASDPASPAYDFTAVDAAVRDTVAAGLTPLLVVTRAPAFAEAPHRWPYAYPGSWAPDPAAFGAFATAVASRYGGSFPDPLVPGRALPRVRLFEAWNEPNLARYLEPQWVVEGGRWVAFSPLLYRQLLNAFYAAVKAVAPGDVVLTAGIAPNGEPAGVGRMTPLRFLDGLLCLEGGAGAACPDPPHFDVLAFHPLSFEGPDVPAHSSQDVAISDIAKVTDLLDRAERLHTALPRGRKPVWVTELNWESAPQSPHGVPGRLQALWISRALHRLWVAGVGVRRLAVPGRPLPRSAAGDPDGRHRHGSAARRPLQPGPRWRTRGGSSQAVPARLHPPLRPAARGPRERARLGAPDAPRSAGPAATQGAGRRVADGRPSARRPGCRAQHAAPTARGNDAARGQRDAPQRFSAGAVGSEPPVSGGGWPATP